MLKKTLRASPLLLALVMLTACSDIVILDNLSQDQANQVLAILQQHNIAVQKNGTLKSGYTVTVNPVESTAALSVISQYQLPWSADVQIAQAFPESSLVASPNAEQARILSLQEQRLAQTLRVIAQVVNVKVHISYPPLDNTLATKKTDNHVGVLISYKGDIDENIFISQIKSLIKHSLDDVRFENISVVLFPAPVIQYASPTQVPAVPTGSWALLLSVFGLAATGIGGCLFYLTRQRYQSKSRSQLKSENEELSSDE
ncbi:EscJ/YscJ/HrcJ family type III secretion inner membrane ring protein [Erwinia sp. E602]|uniref:type III secretion system inner membrane ring lipoprotein SctJ n=1 Tax=Erwinia sp. E602 TaxID=2675378 RepID=UPI001BAB1A98|nr:type III secretion inner membrane ring lipoprotein SctJ [Erwinia sp. E602]QUG74578.1 EscJ/YscJ/HrcJ family type III secretion inner membrane ring protein [Erwinia sp. E602]